MGKENMLVRNPWEQYCSSGRPSPDLLPLLTLLQRLVSLYFPHLSLNSYLQGCSRRQQRLSGRAFLPVFTTGTAGTVVLRYSVHRALYWMVPVF